MTAREFNKKSKNDHGNSRVPFGRSKIELRVKNTTVDRWTATRTTYKHYFQFEVVENHQAKSSSNSKSSILRSLKIDHSLG